MPVLADMPGQGSSRKVMMFANWKFPVGGRVISGPMTYSLPGKQYVEISAGNSVFVFALK